MAESPPQSPASSCESRKRYPPTLGGIPETDDGTDSGDVTGNSAGAETGAGSGKAEESPAAPDSPTPDESIYRAFQQFCVDLGRTRNKMPEEWKRQTQEEREEKIASIINALEAKKGSKTQKHRLVQNNNNNNSENLSRKIGRLEIELEKARTENEYLVVQNAELNKELETERGDNRILQFGLNDAHSALSSNHQRLTSRISQLERELDEAATRSALCSDKKKLVSRISELERELDIAAARCKSDKYTFNTSKPRELDYLAAAATANRRVRDNHLVSEREEHFVSRINALETNLEWNITESKKQERILKDQITALEVNLEWNLETFVNREIDLNERIAHLEGLLEKNEKKSDEELLEDDSVEPPEDISIQSQFEQESNYGESAGQFSEQEGTVATEEMVHKSRRSDLVPKAQHEKYSKAYFEDRIKTLRSEITRAVPDPEELIDGMGGSLYRPLLRSLEAANQTLSSCKAVQAEVQKEQKKHPDDDGWKDASLADPIGHSVEEAQVAIDNLEEAATDACCAILKDSGLLDDEGCGGARKGSLQAIEHALLECTVLVQATPEKLAEWCALSPEVHGSLLDVFLQDNGSPPSSSMMARFLEAGGPSRGNYGRALEIYDRLVTEEGNVPPISTSVQSGMFSEEEDSLRHRLALAVALELATPIPIFHREDTFVDPIERFRYYAKFAPSLEDGDDALDKSFATLSVWELRKVVDSNATHEDLTWGREFLRNYRPDQIYTKDSKWRYVYSVRTDVGYRHPDHDFSNYQELLSAGGECGPRAFFGRFVCKAWGNPTWGVRQPGHAAMTRWTDDGSGWKVCLGADWKFSWWDDDRYGSREARQGPDFHEESLARTAAGGPAAYYGAVVLLECLAESLGETVEAGFAQDKLWRSLALAQRKKLAREVSSSSSGPDAPSLLETADTDPSGVVDGVSLPREIVGQAKATSPTKSVPAGIPQSRLEDGPAGIIVIPAASFVKPEKPTSNVMVLNSYGGGNQLHLEHNGQVEYQLPQQAGTFLLSFRVVNVHRDQKPLRIEVFEDHDSTSDEDDDDDDSYEMVPLPPPQKQSLELEVPYTQGYWKETPDVRVELRGGGRLGLSRNLPCWGLSIKDIVLRPVE